MTQFVRVTSIHSSFRDPVCSGDPPSTRPFMTHQVLKTPSTRLLQTHQVPVPPPSRSRLLMTHQDLLIFFCCPVLTLQCLQSFTPFPFLRLLTPPPPFPSHPLLRVLFTCLSLTHQARLIPFPCPVIDYCWVLAMFFIRLISFPCPVIDYCWVLAVFFIRLISFPCPVIDYRRIFAQFSNRLTSSPFPVIDYCWALAEFFN